MKSLIRIKCDECGKEFSFGNRKDGLPNGVSFVLEDGSHCNVCTECLIEIGRKAEGKNGKNI